MSSSIRKLFGALRLYKLGIFHIILNKLFSGVFGYKTVIFYYFNLNGEDSANQFKKEPVTFKRIENHQDELFKKFYSTYPDQRFASRIKQESKECYVALKNGEVIAYAWITYEGFYIDEINYTYPLENDEFFIYDCFVAREYRGMGIYPAMLCKILMDYTREYKYNLAYIGVASFNTGSIRGIEKTGFKEYNRIKYIKWLNKEKRWGLGRRPVMTVAEDSVTGM